MAACGTFQSDATACQINSLGFCIGCPVKCSKGEKCWFFNRWGSCKFAHATPAKGWGAPHENCRFQQQDQSETSVNFDQVLTDKLSICTLNIGLTSDRSKLTAFLQRMRCGVDIVCLQELLNDKDLMELLDDLKKTKFTFCVRSSHSHCAILSTLPLQEVSNENPLLSSHLHPQMVRDNLPSANKTTRNKGKSEFVTAKVQGILLTCVHLPGSQGGLGEKVRMRELKKTREELEKKNLWGQEGGGAKHIFAGDFNSLTLEDKDMEGWERVGKEREAKNSKLQEAILLCQQLEGQSPGAELDEVRAQLAESLEGLGIEPREPLRSLISHLKYKKLEPKPKFDLTKWMLEEKFKDAWREGGESGRTGSQTTCK